MTNGIVPKIAEAYETVAAAILVQDVDQALDILSSLYVHLQADNFDSADEQLGRVIAQAAYTLRVAGELDPDRERIEQDFARLLDALLWTSMANAVLFGINYPQVQKLASSDRLSNTVLFFQAMSAYVVGKFARSAGILAQLREDADEPLVRTLRLLLLHAEAQRYPRRHNELRDRAVVMLPELAALTPVPVVILAKVVELYFWLGREDLEEFVSKLNEEDRASIPQSLLFAISERSRLNAAIRSNDATQVIGSIAALELAHIPLPTNECAQLLLNFDDVPTDEMKDFSRALESHRGARTPFLLSLSILHLVSLERFKQAHDILEPILNDHLSSYRDDGFADFYARATTIISLFRYVSTELRRKSAAPLNLNEVLVRWTPFLLDKAKNDSLAQGDRVRWLEIYTALQSVYIDFADRAHINGAVRSILGVSVLNADVRVLAIVAALIRSAAQRPNSLIREMDEALREAVEAAYPDVASFTGRLAEQSGGELPTYASAVVSILDYYGRYDDILEFCTAAREVSSAVDHQYTIAGLLLSRRHRRLMVLGAKDIERLYESGPPDKEYLGLLVDAKLKLAKSGELSRFVTDETDLLRFDPATAAEVARIIWGYDLAHSVLRTQLEAAAKRLVVSQTTKELFLIYVCRQHLSENKFLSETANQLDTVRQPAKPRAAIVLLPDGIFEFAQMPFLSFVELKARGFAVFSAGTALLKSQATQIEPLNEIEGAIGSMWNVCRWAVTASEWLNEWEIDFPAKRAVCHGVNFFRGLEESLCGRFRRWSLDFDDVAVRHAAFGYLWEMDLVIVWVDRLKEIARATGVPIQVFTATVHSGNHFAVRAYVNAVSDTGDVTVVQACDAYQNYYNNFSSDHGSAIALRNMTRYKTLGNAFYPTVDEFEKWFESGWKPDKSKSEWASKVVHIDRIGKQGTDDAGRMRHRLSAAREAGKSIVCLFGKILFDQGFPVRGGPAHSGMRDWVKHSLEIAAGCQDLILLIKPHPHELRPDIAVYPSEMFGDWVPSDAPENVILLPHHMFNLYEVAELIDLAIMWNGTSSVELGILQVPTIVCGLYGQLDYPIGHVAPRDRDHYAWLLTHPREVVPRPDIADRGRAFMELLASAQVSTPYRYTRRGNTNKKSSRYEWFDEDLKRYHAQGDPFVTFLADRIESELIELRGG